VPWGGPRRTAFCQLVMASASAIDMKISAKRSIGFYVRAASVFLQGSPARVGTAAKEALPARDPAEKLSVSGLGESISTAIATAVRLESSGLGKIISVETEYPEMPGGEHVGRIVIGIERIAIPPITAPAGGVSAVTWNIAAVNNNPFEYWVTHTDKAYASLMADIERFVETPGERDLRVREVFTEDLFVELKQLMAAEGWSGLDEVERLWRSDLCERKIVSGVLKDKSLGSKRLCSMPDRFTNTIRTTGVGPMACAFRPTPINHSSVALGSVKEWWAQWKAFMFNLHVEVCGKDGPQSVRPCSLLAPIRKAKYPAITEDEEAVSVPLQCVCLAIFDAVLVHMLGAVSPDGHWQSLKEAICEATFRKKNENIIRVLQRYGAADVVCLQEVATSFLDQLKREFPLFRVVAPEAMDVHRNQNSAVLLRTSTFPTAPVELTAEVLAALEGDVLVEKGDLLAVRVKSASGTPFLIASFHGDTNGQVTKPVLRAVSKVLAGQNCVGCRLIFGLDANTYLKGDASMLGVQDFLEECQALGLRSCCPDGIDMAKFLTTCSARTYLQPQLNKAVRSAERLEKGDVNPKDHIVFARNDFELISSFRDNTGEGKYIEGESFPTLHFPSDHGMVAAVLKQAAKM